MEAQTSPKPITLEQLRVGWFMRTVQRYSEESQLRVSRARRNYAIAAMIEAFWWLRLGAQIGFLDLELANCEFKQNSSVLRNCFEGFIDHWGHVLDSEMVGALTQAFARKELVEVQDVITDSAAVHLHRFFQEAALCAQRFDQTPSVRYLVSALAFSPENEWQYVLNAPITSKDVIGIMERSGGESTERDAWLETKGAPSHEAISLLAYSYWEARRFDAGSPEDDWLRAEEELSMQAERLLDRRRKATAVAGTLLAIEHVKAIGEVLDCQEQQSSVDEGLWRWFAGSIALGSRWRLGFRDAARRHRFLQLCEHAGRLMFDDCSRYSVKFDVRGFVGEIDNFIGNWSHLGSRHRVAGH